MFLSLLQSLLLKASYYYPHFLVFITASAYGGIIEFIQPFWEREADIWDFWTNIAGIIFGILIAKGINYLMTQT